MRVIAYTYEGASHCVDCTQSRAADESGFAFSALGPDGNGIDEHDLPYGLQDREGNFINPVFDIDHGQIDDDGYEIPPVCGTCRKEI